MKRRQGFTLVELLIGLILVSIIGTALTRVMLSQMRFFSTQSAQRAARSISRASLNILRGDLEMVEAGGGMISATNQKVVARVPYAVGVVCSGSVVSLLPIDSLTAATAEIHGYAYKDTSMTGAFTYVYNATPPATSSPSACTAVGVQITTLPGGQVVILSPALPPTATTGAPVLLYQRISYEFKASSSVPGRLGLWRTVEGGAADELAAPFDSTAKFRFFALNVDSSSVTVPSPVTTIRGIDLQLDAQAENLVSGRPALENAKLRTSIFFRNRVD